MPWGTRMERITSSSPTGATEAGTAAERRSRPAAGTPRPTGRFGFPPAAPTPVLDTQDLNFQLDYRSTPTSPWITLTGAYLLSNGVAYGRRQLRRQPRRVYPGYWMGEDGATRTGETRTPTARRRTGSRPRAPESTTCPGPSRREALLWARPPSRGCSSTVCLDRRLQQLRRRRRRGAEVAISGAFQVGGTAYDDTMTIPQTAFLDMPSMVLKPTIPGDANLDGKVDVNDLTIVLTNFGQTTNMNWSTGDFNGDGRVDVNDLTIVLAHFGQSVGSGGVAPVPEPSTVVIVAAGLLGLLACAWKNPRLKENPVARCDNFCLGGTGFALLVGKSTASGVKARIAAFRFDDSDPPASNVTAAARAGERGEGLRFGLLRALECGAIRGVEQAVRPLALFGVHRRVSPQHQTR